MTQQYEIIVRGHLTPQWAAVFDGMEINCLPDGNTRLTGNLPDQTALYGLLMRFRDLGLSLVSLKAVDVKEQK